MTTIPKLAARLPEDAGLRSLARRLYDEGIGAQAHAVIRLRVDRRAELVEGDFEVRLLIEAAEAEVGADGPLAAILRERYEGRTSGDKLPFEGEPGHERYRQDLLLKDLHGWQLDGDLTDEQVTERWLSYFGEDTEPAQLGPKHVAFAVLQEFCLATGVITGERDERIRAEAEQAKRDAESATAQSGDTDAGPGAEAEGDSEPDDDGLHAGDPVFDGVGVPGHVLGVHEFTVTVQYVIPGHVKPEQMWHINQVTHRDPGATETTQVEPAAEPGIHSEEPAAPAVPVVAFSDQSGEITAKRRGRA